MCAHARLGQKIERMFVKHVFVKQAFVKRVFANDFFGIFIVAIDSRVTLWYRACIDITTCRIV